MTPAELQLHARALVATWPPLTEQDNRELTKIARRSQRRRQQTAVELPAAA